MTTSSTAPSLGPSNRLRKFRNLLLAAGIVPAVMLAIFLWIDFFHVFREAEKQAIGTAKVFQQHALNVFETHKLVSERIDERLKGMSWEAIAGSAEIRDYLVRVKRDYPQVNSIWLADATGLVRNATEPLPASPLRISDRDYFFALRNADVGPFVGRIINGRVIKRLLFNIATRRHNGTENFDGVIIVTADPTYFNQFWNLASPEKEFSAGLIREDGSILARTTEIHAGWTTLPPNSAFMKMRQSKDQGPYYGRSAVDGVKRIYAMKSIPGYNVHVVYGLKYATAVREWLQHLLYYGCIFLVAMAILSTISLLAYRHAKGEQEALNELNRLNDELERRVVERTAELRDKDKMLLQQNRLAAMGEMINNIAHQWRQPLNLMGLHVQTIQLFFNSGKCTQEFMDGKVDESMKLIRHMSQTIDDFRNFFKPDKKKTVFMVNQAVQQAMNLVQDTLSRNAIQVTSRLESDGAAVYGYPNEFSQVVLNVLHNAADALAGSPNAEKRIEVESAVRNGKAVVTITDNAGGIPEEIMDKIFEPYFSTKGCQGTGIGLYMSKSIIETNMGGSITAVNTGQGASFRIEFDQASGA